MLLEEQVRDIVDDFFEDYKILDVKINDSNEAEIKLKYNGSDDILKIIDSLFQPIF